MFHDGSFTVPLGLPLQTELDFESAFLPSLRVFRNTYVDRSCSLLRNKDQETENLIVKNKVRDKVTVMQFFPNDAFSCDIAVILLRGHTDPLFTCDLHFIRSLL